MILKKIIALGAAVVVFATGSLNVSAAGLKDVFDATYYANKYSDLKATFGDDEEALYQHFIEYGIREGRNMSPILDVVAYRKAYADLDNAFGENWDAYVDHFLTYGVYESGRKEGVLFDPLEYAEAYADVKEAYGTDIKALVKHYQVFGQKEAREEGTAKGYGSVAERKEVEKMLEQKAEENQKPKGVGSECLAKCAALYQQASELYIAYRNAGEEDKSSYASQYNATIEEWLVYRMQIIEQGTDEELEQDQEHMMGVVDWTNSQIDDEYGLMFLPDSL